MSAGTPAAGKRYEFRTMADLDQLQPDQIEGFLTVTDFRSWVVVRALAGALPGMVEMQNRDVFVWIDDGRHDCHITARLVPDATAPAVVAPSPESL